MSAPKVAVLRLGHRVGRDPRITTHLGLVARAFGADTFYLAGDEDSKLFDSLSAVGERFGAPLSLAHVKSPMRLLRRWVESDCGDGSPGVAVHLTMYGESFQDAIPKMNHDRPLLIVVGGAKVPGEIFKFCQHNVAIGNQPHSEVAALALFLYEWDSKGMKPENFKGGRLEVVPSVEGKIVIDNESE